ncbi:hypothetical protein [Sphingobacterium multivorum]|uniref:hypothetical protein n=1 Tax=Sphingobacterium multivorum TaxID=28454 RepID=UPI003679A690
MKEDNMKWCEYFIEVITPFMDKSPSIDIVYNWFFGSVDDLLELQPFVINNTKSEFKWTSGLGLIEGCATIVNEAISNGNILKN